MGYNMHVYARPSNRVQKGKVFCFVFIFVQSRPEDKTPKGFYISDFRCPGQVQDSLLSLLCGLVVVLSLGYRMRDRYLK